MIEAEKTLVNVSKGQDAYSVIGNYILNHVTAIEDMIAVIQINGVIIKELYMVDLTVDGYFIWESDWWEGDENVALIDFFPVSDACNPKNHWIPCSERLPNCNGVYLVWRPHFWSGEIGMPAICYFDGQNTWHDSYGVDFERVLHPDDVTAWMPLPRPYDGE